MRRRLDYCADGDRRLGAAIWLQALVENCRNQSLLPREKFKRRTPRDESAEARHWGGLARGSDEDTVMGDWSEGAEASGPARMEL